MRRANVAVVLSTDPADPARHYPAVNVMTRVRHRRQRHPGGRQRHRDLRRPRQTAGAAAGHRQHVRQYRDPAEVGDHRLGHGAAATAPRKSRSPRSSSARWFRCTDMRRSPPIPAAAHCRSPAARRRGATTRRRSTGGNPVPLNTDGDVGTNGNLALSGTPTTINGTLSTPRTGVGSCTANNVTALTVSGQATVSEGLVELPQVVSYDTPPAPSPLPPTTSVEHEQQLQLRRLYRLREKRRHSDAHRRPDKRGAVQLDGERLGRSDGSGAERRHLHLQQPVDQRQREDHRQRQGHDQDRRTGHHQRRSA